MQSLHFLTGIFPLQLSTSLSHTDSHSCSTAFIPFSTPCSLSSGWSSGYTSFWIWPYVSGWPGFGGGLLRGIVVSQRCVYFPPGLTCILLTFKVSSARPLCAKEWSKSHITTLSGFRYLKILIACCIWSISCNRSHHVWHGGLLACSCLLIFLPFISTFPTLQLELSSLPLPYLTYPLIHSSPVP